MDPSALLVRYCFRAPQFVHNGAEKNLPSDQAETTNGISFPSQYKSKVSYFRSDLNSGIEYRGHLEVFHTIDIHLRINT
jgi:hypothetical protein